LARGKYIALCECDDYWTDALKLQKQVDFLNAHSDFSICCHKVEIDYEKHKDIQEYWPNITGDQVFTIENLLMNSFIPTCSVVFRKFPFGDYFNKISNSKIGDWPLHVYNAQFGNIKFYDEIMASYRIHSAGIFSNSNWLKKLEMSLSGRKVVLNFLNPKYKLMVQRSIFDICYRLSKGYYEIGSKAEARKYISDCISYLPGINRKRLSSFLKLFSLIYTPKIYRAVRNIRKSLFSNN